MIHVHFSEGAELADDRFAGRGPLKWRDCLRLVDTLSALLPWERAGGFRDRAEGALRDLHAREDRLQRADEIFNEDDVVAICLAIFSEYCDR